MKIQINLFVFLFAVASIGAFAADPPKGFEDPALLAKVMSGKIVDQVQIDTKTEYKVVLRAYFAKTSPEAYAGIATNHPKYPSMFEEIQSAETTKVNAQRTDFEYKMTVLVQYGPFQLQVHPTGRQVFTPGADPRAEGAVAHNITNYQDVLEIASQGTRLIPYDNGMLVEDSIHVKVRKDYPPAQAAAIKTQLKKTFTRFLEVFRRELSATP